MLGHRSNWKDYTGEVVNGIKILHETTPSYGKDGTAIRRCTCICPQCGNEFVAYVQNVVRGTTSMCKTCLDKHRRESNTTHNMSRTRLYRIWQGMHERCYNPHNVAYDVYGARGITVCNAWKNTTRMVKDGNRPFVNFKDWAYENGYYDQPRETRWNDMLSIDRIDVNGSYSPENCRWITMREQALNRQNTRLFKCFEKTISLAELKDRYHITSDYVANRDKHHWSNNAILHSILNQEVGLRKTRSGSYIDKDGFTVLIPNYGNQ